MTTVADIRRQKKFLTPDSTYYLIRLLTKQCSNDTKQQMGSIIRNSFYSLEDNPYWDKFILHVEGIEYKGNLADIPAIRLDILSQR